MGERWRESIAGPQPEAGQSRTYRLKVEMETVAVGFHSGLQEKVQVCHL